MPQSIFATKEPLVGISHISYENVQNYIDSVKVISNISTETIYIVDYFTQKILYISPNSPWFSGPDNDEILKTGVDYFIRHFPEGEFDLFCKIKNAGFELLYKYPIEDRKKFHIVFDTFMVSNSAKTLVTHKIAPLALDDVGNIWLMLGSVSLTHNRKSGNARVIKQGHAKHWKLNMRTRKWHETSTNKLSLLEKEVLSLSAMGLTTLEIATKTHRSKETIKSRKRQIFDKLGVGNITEALMHVFNYKIL